MAFERTNHHKLEYSASERNFGVVFSIFMLLIGCHSLFMTDTVRLWAFAAAALLMAISALCPVILKPFNKVWGKFGLLLGTIITPIVLVVLYIAVIMPIGLIARVLGKDPLTLKKQSSRDSYWITRNNSEDIVKNLPNQF